MKRILMAALALLIPLAAQDSREALGPQDHPGQNGPSPLAALMASRRSALLPQLRGQHPRVFFTGAELDTLRRRAHSSQSALWARALAAVRAVKVAPPPTPAEERRAQNEVGLGIAEAAFAYRMEGDRKYLDAALRYMDAAVSYNIWGYAFNKPNVDLAAGHLLYGMGAGYDLLYHDLSADQRRRYRDAIAEHARLLFDYYRPKPGRTYAYSQNHVFIPMAGLGVAAYALYDEIPDAPQWAALSRAIFDRTLATYSPDGYYYEGFEYWIFATPWIVHYLDAHQHSTGEDLFDQPGLKQTYLYAAYSLLPGGQDIFDFGDAFEGPLARAHREPEYSRTHPAGRFSTNYNVLFDLAARYRNPDAQGVAKWMESLGHVNQEEWWSLAWYDERLAATPISKLPAWHYFPDHEVAYWRTGWDAGATAVAFKCGPPEGHHTARLLPEMPDWHLSAGHSHPDANSFILFAHGRYLTGDSGYAGVPKTDQHNTLLIDGRGQGFDDRKQHDPWEGFPYTRLDQVRISAFTPSPDAVEIEGDAAGAYDPAVGLTRFHRRVRLNSGGALTVDDEVESSREHRYTELLHSDDGFSPRGKDEFEIPAGPVRLRVLWHGFTDAESRIEPNLVTAAGQPGSVSEGEIQQRGERLTVTTREPARNARFQWDLKVVLDK